jgi:hypothetical protein
LQQIRRARLCQQGVQDLESLKPTTQNGDARHIVQPDEQAQQARQEAFDGDNHADEQRSSWFAGSRHEGTLA